MSHQRADIYSEALEALGLCSREDYTRWERVIALAEERSYELSEILWSFRLDGARLDLRGQTLAMGAGTMGPSYAHYAQRYLMPLRPELTDVFREAARPELGVTDPAEVVLQPALAIG